MSVALFVCLLFIAGADLGTCGQQEQLFKVPNLYIHFNQCYSEWKDDIIEIKTICKVGCLLSSVSMALNYYHIAVNNQSANPGTVNAWLRDHSGYVGDDNLDEKSLEKLSPNIKYIGKIEKLAVNDTVEYLNNGVVTIAHVRNGTHFVLLKGYTAPLPSQNWLVNDPFYNQTIYTTEDIVGYRIFTMK